MQSKLTNEFVSSSILNAKVSCYKFLEMNTSLLLTVIIAVASADPTTDQINLPTVNILMLILSTLVLIFKPFLIFQIEIFEKLPNGFNNKSKKIFDIFRFELRVLNFN